jgi:tetratricopeptide (TPR) repeat protein
MPKWVAVICVGAALSAAAAGQENKAAKANTIWETGNRLDALPFYEELAKEFPNEWLYSERLAVALEVKAEDTGDRAEQRALLVRVRQEAIQAVKDGDPNYYAQLMANIDVEAAMQQKGPMTPARKMFAEGEKAFGTGDYAKALDGYRQALELDPTFYEAALYAGDAAYSNKDLKTAAVWFARAIAIDANRETAYRYWGDAILKYGSDPEAAKDKFIDAILADPYNKLSWQGITNWARVRKAVLMAPKIELPAGPQRDAKNPKNIPINVDPGAKGTSSAVWVSYQMSKALWAGDKFKQEFPDAKEYRHTLREEDDALTTSLKVAEEMKVDRNDLDESLRNLMDLNKAGMLDCWIVISGADNGIAQDYAAYRKGHRQLLRDYIARFVVHGGVTPAAE